MSSQNDAHLVTIDQDLLNMGLVILRVSFPFEHKLRSKEA
jgi:hypothetical protein